MTVSAWVKLCFCEERSERNAASAVGLPQIFELSSGCVEKATDASPIRGILQNTEPDVVPASDTGEGHVGAQFVCRSDLFGLPQNVRLRIERRDDSGNINFQTNRNDLTVPRTTQDFGSSDKQRDFPQIVFAIEVEVATHRRGISTVHDAANCIIHKPSEP